MKIKKSLFLMLMIVPMFTAFGQIFSVKRAIRGVMSSGNVEKIKVKVKKEVLSINKKDVGFFVDEKVYQRQKQFAVLNKKRDTLFKVGREVVFSLLDGEDEIYLYESFSVPNKQIKKHYPIGRGYNFTAKSIIRRFVSLGIIDEQLNVNESKLNDFQEGLVEVPSYIEEVLEKEKREMKNIDFIADKVKNGFVSLKKTNSTSEIIKYLYRPDKYFFDEYKINSISKNKEEETKLQIGKVVIRYPMASMGLSNIGVNAETAPTGGDLSKSVIFIYNNKGGRVARLGAAKFGDLHVYNGSIVKKNIDHKLFEEKSILARTRQLINWLILEGKL